MRTIVYLSGTRADYGLMKSTLSTLHQSNEFDLRLIISGMHLKEEYGNTITEIENDNFTTLGKLECFPEDDTTSAMSKSLGECIIGVTSLLEKNHVDLVLLQGDRGEQLAGAIAAAHLNIPVCHVSGGDVTGSIDDKIRNAISMFADIHCPATKFSADRLKGSLNIREELVYIVGEPGLDDLVSFEFMERDTLFDKFNFDKKLPLFLIIQHPVTEEMDLAGEHMLKSMEAIMDFQANKLIIYPNSDAGGKRIIKVIKEFESLQNVTTIKNLKRDDFFNVMKHCDVMIGNSSSGIVEASSLQIPVINIGTRQNGRLQAGNIINVDNDKEKIHEAIKKALDDELFHKSVQEAINPYGDGHSSEMIYSVIKDYFRDD